jgi:hypothetical protein
LDEGGEALRRVIERVDEDYSFGRPVLEVPDAHIAPSEVVPRGAMIGLGEIKLDALEAQIAGFVTAEELRGYLDQASVEGWLARFRRNQPDRAVQADAIIAAAWERIRKAEATPPWCIIGRDGARVACEGREAWLAVWRQRVAAIEGAPRSAAARRAALEAMLKANHHTLRAVERVNAKAALEATKASADAASRLAAQDQAPLAAE